MSHFIFNLFRMWDFVVLNGRVKKKTRIYATPAVEGLNPPFVIILFSYVQNHHVAERGESFINLQVMWYECMFSVSDHPTNKPTMQNSYKGIIFPDWQIVSFSIFILFSFKSQQCDNKQKIINNNVFEIQSDRISLVSHLYGLRTCLLGLFKCR